MVRWRSYVAVETASPKALMTPVRKGRMQGLGRSGGRPVGRARQ